MRLAGLFFTIFCSLSIFAKETSNSVYIRDVESLLNSVESRDSSRPQLTLKLADAFFNEALGLSGQPALNEAEKRRLVSDRRRAIQLYQDSLTGLKGLFPLPSGPIRGKIQFQLARIYADLGEMQSAEQLWKGLAENDSLPDVQRESLLRLAELLENRASREDLKRAESYYKKALTLCSNQDVCSYSHYRLAWVYQRQDRVKEAIGEMNLALWDSKGQVREESLRDLVSFMGGLPDDGKDSLTAVEKLSAKLNRPQLIGDMSDAYFAHGNRKAGVYILDAVNRKHPTLKSYVRLMEEDYGFRDWPKFETDLDGAMDIAVKGNVPKDVETEKILRRLTVQLDGERASQPKSAEEFKRSVMLYLALYPSGPERAHMIDGWIAAETDDAAKMKQLQSWIQDEKLANRNAEEVRLRKIRASVAQKAKDYGVVVEEMSALQSTMKTSSQKAENAYQIAYAEYLNKDYEHALPAFQELAKPSAGNTPPDKWAIQSEHLALDILGQKKDYAGVAQQARIWTKSPYFAAWVANVKEHKEELADIQKIETSSEFQYAASLGNSPEALAVFYRDCTQGVLLPQSCANAQVLAVKLGDQSTLIEVLKKLGKSDELAAELEASAEFAAAAPILEKKLKDKDSATRDYLKVALLYELGGSTVNRDRVLHQMTSRLEKSKTLGPEEDLILQTLKEGDLINSTSLKLPWKKENREYLIDYLASHGKMTPEMQKSLTASCHDTGPAWEKNALIELEKLDDKQRAIHFAGNGSKRKFEQRVASVKTLMDRGNCYLSGSSAPARVVFATLLSRSESGLAEEIKASPIPEGVDAEGKASLEKALNELAQPFADKAQEFTKLAGEQLDKVESAEERDALKAKIANTDAKALTIEPVVAHSAPLKVGEKQSGEVLNGALQELHRNPNQRSSLVQLKSYYESNGNTRLAAYFQGRLLQLGDKVGEKPTEEVKQ